MSTISQIVALQRRAAVAARLPGAATSSGTTASGASALVTLGAAIAPVTYADRIKRTGKVGIDALLAGGSRWFHDSGGDGSVPSAVARHTLTYSFMEASDAAGSDANGFQTLDGGQRQRVRDALDYYAQVVDISFSEVASGGDLQYGANVQNNSAGYARYPNEGSQVLLAANQSTFAGSWEAGSYEWEVLLHETGHALGLKHPGNYNAGGGGTPGPYLPTAADNRGNTLMSYRNAGNMQRVVATDGRLSKQVVNPRSLQSLDITALQYLYGASQSSTAQTYSWATDEVFSQTIWNPNAGSTIDLSNQTKNNVVDLRGGHYSSVAVRNAYADTTFSKQQYDKLVSGGRKVKDILGAPTYTGANNLFVAAGSRITQASGGSGNDSFVANGLGDSLAGGAGNDRFFWNGGNLSVDGGDGSDAVLVKKVAGASWKFSEDKTSLTLNRRDAKTGSVTTLGTISLTGVESVRWWDGASLKAVGTAIYTA